MSALAEALVAAQGRRGRARQGWRVVCLSTPNTIYRDLLGHRERDSDPVWQGVAHNRPDGLRSPERYKLAAFGGLDVLALEGIEA